MIFFKKKPVVLKCYTDRADVYNYFPVVKASKTIPEWFKNLPRPKYTGLKKTENIRNLKECIGFTNYFAKGFMLPLWSDLALEIGEKGTDRYRYQYSDQRSEIIVHPGHTTGNTFSDLEYQEIKLSSPWLFQCTESIEFMCLQPEWFLDKIFPVHIVAGVMDFTTNVATNINAYIKRTEEEQNIFLQAGTPIYHFIPLTEKKVQLEVHLVTTEKFQNLNLSNSPVTFRRHHAKKHKILKEKKCPFKFDAES